MLAMWLASASLGGVEVVLVPVLRPRVKISQCFVAEGFDMSMLKLQLRVSSIY